MHRTNPQGHQSGDVVGANMVDRYIGSAFDVVYEVYKNLENFPILIEFALTWIPRIEGIEDRNAEILERYENILIASEDAGTSASNAAESLRQTLEFAQQVAFNKEETEVFMQAAQRAASDATESAEQAEEYKQQAVEAVEQAVQDVMDEVDGQVIVAEAAADRAETARDASFINADVYPDVASGLAAVAEGEQFQVVEGDEIVRYRRVNATVAEPVARFPAKKWIDDELFGSSWTPVDTINIVEGYVVSVTGPGDVLVPNNGGAYISLDLEDVVRIRVTSPAAVPSWRWVFVDEDGTRLTAPKDSGENVELSVPAGATKAYRTYKTSQTEDIGVSIGVKFKWINKTISELDRVERKQEVLEDLAYLEEGRSIEYSRIDGALVNTDSTAEEVTLHSGTGRQYIKVDVSEYSKIEISGADQDRAGWSWVFGDANNIAYYSRFGGNGSVEVPEGAIWGYRTVQTAVYSENEGMTLFGVYRVRPTVKDEVIRLRDSPSSPSGLIEVERRLAANIEVGRDSLESFMVKQFVSGCMLDINQFSGASQHDQIENAIKFIKKRGWGILRISRDVARETSVWLRNSAVLMPSNCWIYLEGTELKMADGVFDNLIRNDGIVPNPDPFGYALELNENQNIRVFGTGPKSSFVSGPDVPFTAPHPINGGTPIPWVGDFFGWRTLPILLSNVKNYKIHGFGMRKTTCWAITQEHGCDDFEVFDIDFDTHVKNGDGVDVRMGCRRGKIYNLTGYTYDDTVALSALQKLGGRTYPDGTAIYPMQVGGYEDRGFGANIEDVKVWNVKGHGENHGVRLLASGGSKLLNISVDDIADSDGPYVARIVGVSSGYGEPAQRGDFVNITVNGVVSHFSNLPLLLSGPISDSSFNYIRQYNPDGELVRNNANFLNSEVTNAEYG